MIYSTELFDLLVLGNGITLVCNNELTFCSHFHKIYGVELTKGKSQFVEYINPSSYDKLLLFYDFFGKDVNTVRRLKRETPVFRVFEDEFLLSTDESCQNQFDNYVREGINYLFHKYNGDLPHYDQVKSVLVVVPPHYSERDIQLLLEVCSELYSKNVVIVDSNIANLNYPNLYDTIGNECAVLNVDDYVLSASVVKKVNGKFRTTFCETDFSMGFNKLVSNVANYLLNPLEEEHKTDRLGREFCLMRLESEIRENFEQGKIHIPYFMIEESGAFHLDYTLTDNVKIKYLEEYLDSCKPFFEKVLPELPEKIVLTSNLHSASVINFFSDYLQGKGKIVYAETKQEFNPIRRASFTAHKFQYSNGTVHYPCVFPDIKINYPDKTEELICKSLDGLPIKKEYYYSAKETDTPYLTIKIIDEEFGEVEIYRKNIQEPGHIHKIDFLVDEEKIEISSSDISEPKYSKHFTPDDKIRIVGEYFVLEKEQLPKQPFYY